MGFMHDIQVNSTEPVRLDRYLRRLYLGATQGVIEKALRIGAIKLNGKKVKTRDRVNSGDVISIRPGLFEEKSEHGSAREFSRSVISLAEKLLSDYLLFSSDEFIAINKPENLAVQGGSKIDLSIDDALEYLNQKHGVEYKLVHRLDKATSGILLIAKGFDNASKLASAFKEKLISKIYIAMLSGCPEQKDGRLSHMIGKDRSGAFEIVKEQKEGGKLAETYYKILDVNSKTSLVEFRPVTGRMHQLRFHSKFLGCPIVGDEKYGGPKYKRMLLHAQKLTIEKKVFGREIIIESIPSDDFCTKINFN
jgi:23S rRNA pseudouridine955/2504/2580 synthase